MDYTAHSGILLEKTFDNVSSLMSVEGLHESNLTRDVALRIRESDGKFLFFASGNGDFFPTTRSWDADCPLNATDVFQYVDSCRRTWQETLVDGIKAFEVRLNPNFGGQENYYFFQREWDYSQQPDVLRQRAGKLAKAGEKLFYLLFEDTNHPQDLLDLGAELKRASREKELVVTITSNCFFVPWGMLYVHPDTHMPLEADGSNFDWKGFWGYRHIVEHNTERFVLKNELLLNGASHKLKFSANVDEGIDTSLDVECVQPLIEFFKGHPLLDPTVQKTKDELGAALDNDNFSDNVLFFCCHGRGSQVGNQTSLELPALKLTDPDLIYATDLNFWRRRRNGILPSHPLVFINACQGGQMTNLFYRDVAAEFLKQQAVGLVGTQIDIPAIFACVYAKRFFHKLLDNRNNPMRVGPLMRELTREFIDTYNNPLGLAYSLYHGADCFVLSPN
jgi:hypothetical protein